MILWQKYSLFCIAKVECWISHLIVWQYRCFDLCITTLMVPLLLRILLVLSRWKVDGVASLVGVPDSNNVSQFGAVLAPPPPWPPGGGVGWSVGGPVSGSVGWPIGGPVGRGPVSGPLGGIVTTATTAAVQKLLAPVVTELWSSACVVPKDFVVELGWWPGVRASGWYWGGGLDGVPPVPAAVSVVPILPDQVINIFQVTPPLTSVVRRFTVSVFASIVVHE